MKTVKEAAEILNVSKQTIHYHLKNLPSNFKVKKLGNKTLIDDDIMSYLEALSNKETTKKSSNKSSNKSTKYDRKTTNENQRENIEIERYMDKYISHLESEIRQKNRQIDDLTIALKQEQSLNLNSQNILSNSEKIETDDTNKKEDIIMQDKPDKNDHKQSLLSKLFKKKE